MTQNKNKSIYTSSVYTKNKYRQIINTIFLLFIILTISNFAFSSDNDFSDLDVNLVNQDPNPVVAGDIVEIRVGVENVGLATAQDIVLEAIEEYPFEIISESIQEIGSIQSVNDDGSNIQIVKFKLKTSNDLSAGTYPLTIEEYSKESPNVITEHEVEIDVETKESLEIISIDKSQILPGQKDSITFKLKNVGSSELKDIIFSWENEEGMILPIGTDNSVYVKNIGVGETIEIPFNILASSSATADLYNLDLKVSYQDSISSSEMEYNTKAGIYIGGDTNFDVIFDEVSGSDYSFTISNIGATDADSVTINVPSQEGWNLNSGNSEIIGNLNQGDYTTVSFDLTKKNSNSIKLIVDYTNTLGERVSVEKNIDVFTQSLGEFNPDGNNVDSDRASQGGMRNMGSSVSKIITWAKYAGLTILVLIVLIIGFKIRKKKQK